MLSPLPLALVLVGLSLAACDRPTAEPVAAPTSKPAAAPTAPPPLEPAQVDFAAAREAPEAFRGKWSASLVGCGGVDDDSRLVIEARQIQFYEGGGSILEVKPAGPREATFETRLSSEGETFERAYRFRLSPDGQTLTDLAGGGFDRKRCLG